MANGADEANAANVADQANTTDANNEVNMANIHHGYAVLMVLVLL